MASPLHYFRKHQGYILAVLGVILIVTWVIGPFLLDYFQPSGGAKDVEAETRRVVVKWKGGNVTRGELDRMRWEHQAAIQFLYAVFERAQQDGATPQAPFMTVSQSGPDLGLFTSISEPVLIHMMLLEQKGKELGVVVDRATVDAYLNELSGYSLREADFQEIARTTLAQLPRSANNTYMVTVSQLFERLEVELLARQVQEMIVTGAGGFSPGQLWDFHEQLHCRYKIEAYPIAVAPYLDQFKASDARPEELKKIYDEGKDLYPDPESAEPGFHKPLRLAFGYVQVDLAPFLEEAKKKISEEQVVAEYEKQVKAGAHRRLKLEDPQTDPPATDSPKGDDADKPADEPAKEKDGDAKAKADDKAKEEEPKGEEKTKAEEPEPAKGEEIGSCQEEPAKEPEAKVDAKDDAKAKTKAAPADDEKAKAEGTPAGDAKAKTKDKPPTDPPSTPATEADGTPADGKPADEKPAEDIKPLSEVRDQILESLALPEARKARDAAVTALTQAVQKYYTRHARWVAAKKANAKSSIKDPGELQIKELAAKYHAQVGQTPLADQFEIRNTVLGQKASTFSYQGSTPFADIAYAQDRELYVPQQISSSFGETTFVYWRTGEEPAEAVPLEKARDKVVQAWIKQQAVAAAKKDAEALAAKAAKAASLAEVLTEEEAKKLVQPLPFSWLTRDTLGFGAPPKLTEVPGIPLAGEDFMKGVFSLEVGQTGVALNQPHTTVYVVRVLAEEPALDIRREMFLSSMQAGFFGDLARFAAMQGQRLQFEILQDLREEYELEWVETPQPTEM